MTELPGLPSGKTGGSLHINNLTNSLRLLARDLANTALEVIFPPHCIQCHRVGSLLCSDCQTAHPVPSLIDITTKSRGQFLPHDQVALALCRATAEFDGAIREAIHAHKYKNQVGFAVPLGQRLAKELRRTNWQPTLITAAPLHESRLKEREYNQAALLAEALARQVQSPYCADVLFKTRQTRPQVGLNAQEHQSNVANAFQASPAVAGQTLLRIDDVYTTGATLHECAKALKEAGASQVYALTVTRARHPSADQTPTA